MAFAFTSYFGNMSQRIEDPSTFQMEVKLRQWGTPENSLETVFNTTDLKTHPCTKEELGLGDTRDGAKFYPMASSFQSDALKLVGNFHCLDNLDDLKMYGEFDSGEAQNL